VTDVIGLIIKARDQASAELSKVGKSLGALEGDIKKAEKAMLAAGAAGAGLLVALGAAANGARDEARTKRQLAKALDSVGESYASLGGQIEGVIAQQQFKTATSDELQRQALVQLLALTGDLNAAMQALSLSIDAAAVTQTGLGEITRQVGNFLEGNISTLETLGLRVDETATASERLAKLEEAVGGQASAAADDIARMHEALADTSDSIGGIVLPALNELAGAIAGVLQRFNELEPAVQRVIVSLGVGAGVAGVLTGLVALIPKVIAGITALKAALAFLTGPLGLVIAGVSALVGALVWFISDEEQAVEQNQLDLAKNMEVLKASSSDARESIELLANRFVEFGREVEAFLGLGDDLESLFRQKFGEIPEEVAAVLEELGVLVEDRTQFTKSAMLDTLDEMLAQVGVILGPEFDGTLAEAGETIRRAWQDGPQQAVEEGVDAVVAEVEKLPEVVSLASVETGGILVDKWATITPLIADPVIFEVDRAISKLAELPEFAAAVVAQTQQKLSAFDGGQIGTAISTGGQFGDLGDAASVQAAIAATQTQISNLQKVLQGGTGPFGSGLVAQANLDAAKLQLQELLALLASFNQPQQFAAGTSFFQGGFASLNEQGPEKVLLPRGSQIQSAGQGGGGGFTNYGSLHIEAGSAMDAELADILSVAV
jgi:hypothetical protein